MLTTIGGKIIELRPKQVIESSILLDNDYLVLLNTGKVSKVKPKLNRNSDEKLREQPFQHPKTPS